MKLIILKIAIVWCEAQYLLRGKVLLKMHKLEYKLLVYIQLGPNF